MINHEILLKTVTENVQKRIKEEEHKKIKGTDFEKIVYEELLKAGVKESAITHSTQKFPDFVITDGDYKFGVEVKKTDAKKWDIQGGSVYESLRNKVETYVIMGKFGGTPEARLRKYEECISDISVTHSPRFHLKLDIKRGEDFLSKNNAFDLLELPEGDELNRRIRELLRTDKDTWYSQETIESFSKLSIEEKINYFVDGVVLFPEVTGGNYSDFAPWMIYKCLVWCSNTRDVFTAGGTKESDCFRASAVMARILERTDLIVKRISMMTTLEIKKHWKTEAEMPLNERVNKWVELINKSIAVSPQLVKSNQDCHPELFEGKEKKDHASIIKCKFMVSLEDKLKASLSEFKSCGERP